uniref:RING-type E3 ubiquitin transferase n=2 Tax=Noccaea caerulescens TaxID=107243 RepID=A0A1J3FRT2_NOCCA
MVGASISDEGNSSSSILPVYSGGSDLRSPVSSGGSDLRSPVYSGGSDLRSPVSSGGSVLRSPVSAGGSVLRSPVSSGDGAKRVCTEDKRLSTTLFNLNVLDCPICFEALTIPIFQCDNGHLACSCCCPKLNNKCPSCALPVGHIRNRAMETVLESIFVPCRNAAFGCTKKFTYGIESEHEEECRYAPCSCPVPDCDYTGSYYNIERHSFVEHRDIWESNCFRFGISFDVRMNISDKLLTWTETSAGLLFPVQCFREPCGVYVSVSCIAPPAPTVGRFSYDISYTVDGQTVIYKSVEAKKILQVSFETPRDNFMLIPASLLLGDLLELNLCIVELDQVYLKI